MQWETLKFSRLHLKHSAYAFMNGMEWNMLTKWRWMDQILSTPLFVACALLSNVTANDDTRVVAKRHLFHTKRISRRIP